MSGNLMWQAATRCEAHERTAEIDMVARAVLVVMASFAKNDPEPEYFGSIQRIADRAGCGRKTAKRALARLEKLGLIENVGRRGEGVGRGSTVRWKLTILASASTPSDLADAVGRGAEKGSERPLSRAEKGSESPLKGVTLTPNQRSTSGALAKEDFDSRAFRSRSADAPRSPARSDLGNEGDDGEGGGAMADNGSPPPGGRATSSASSASQLTLWVSEQLGHSTDVAERWIKERVNASSGPVNNINAYIRSCVAKQLAGAKRQPRRGKAKPGELLTPRGNPAAPCSECGRGHSTGPSNYYGERKRLALCEPCYRELRRQRWDAGEPMNGRRRAS